MRRHPTSLLIVILSLVASACGGPDALEAVAVSEAVAPASPTAPVGEAQRTTTSGAAGVTDTEELVNLIGTRFGPPDGFPIPIPDGVEPDGVLGRSGLPMEFTLDIGTYGELESLYTEWFASSDVEMVFDEELGTTDDPGRHIWSGFVGSEPVIVRLQAKLSKVDVTMSWFPEDPTRLGFLSVPTDFRIAIPEGGVVSFVDRDIYGGDSVSVGAIYRLEKFDELTEHMTAWIISAGAEQSSGPRVDEKPPRRWSWLGTLDDHEVVILITEGRDGLVSLSAGWVQQF